MSQEARILEAIKQSGVSRIAVIDDAFDAPEITKDNVGELLEYLEGADFATVSDDIGISEDVRRLAIKALNETDYAASSLVTCVEALYKRFVTAHDSRFDPAGIFLASKGDNLKNIMPTLKLLEKCNPPLVITRIGSKPEDIEAVGPETHVILVDFYLDPSLPAGETPTGKQKKTAKSMALDRVTKLIEAQATLAPSIVLMSSHQVRAEAEKFRSDIGSDHSRVFASRFTFVEKTHLRFIANDEIDVAADAADALLNIFQSYEFGRALHAALRCWLESAAVAVNAVGGEIEHLELKDFAYLARFRLAQEGEGLVEYLEWFFGECLLDTVGKAVDSAAEANDLIRALNGSAADRIEGSFDGPTKKVADLYHRVRIEDPRKSRSSNYRLGDLYLTGEGNKRSIVAVVTPDCDLIVRDGGKRQAPRLLTLSGKLKSFDAPDTSVSDFLILNKQAHNIIWDKKAIETKEFDGWPKPGNSSRDFKYLGTLRPLYAQEIQRNLLHDLGRVGLSVAPAIGMTAAVQIVVKRKGGEKQPLEVAGNNTCYVIPSRGVGDKTRVIFKRQFVRSLIAQLSGLEAAPLVAQADGHILQLKKPDAYTKLAKMFRTGVFFEEFIDLGIFLTVKTAFKSTEGGPWCWLIVSMVEQT